MPVKTTGPAKVKGPTWPERRAKLTQQQLEKDRDGRREYQSQYREKQRKDKANQIETTYPVLKSIDATSTTTTNSGLSITVCGCHSSKQKEETFRKTVEGNDIVLAKFIQDLEADIPILATESVAWNGRKAWAPLSWTAIDDDDQILYPDGDFENQDADARFCTFVNSPRLVLGNYADPWHRRCIY